MTPDLMIVGAGITGLTAAIAAAEGGRRVTVAEAHARTGGLARTLDGPYRANTGPHAVYVDGAWWRWLEDHGRTPPVVAAPADGSLVRSGGRLMPWPSTIRAAAAALPADAPVGEPYGTWLLRHTDAGTAAAILALAFIATFDHDPGRLSAAFVHERVRRSLRGGARYVVGGWSTLVELLTEHARDLGVRIETETRVSDLEVDAGAGAVRVPGRSAGAVVLATGMAAARRLTGDPSLTWTGARVATFDLGLRTEGAPGWFRVLDLDDRIYAARYGRTDATLAPPGHDLLQVSAACAPHERRTDVEHRVEALLDQAWPGWRAAVAWRRGAVRTDCTGAVELPGTTWHDRPPIGRGGALAVATDQSAAPGLLAEVGVNAALLAVQHLDEPAEALGHA